MKRFQIIIRVAFALILIVGAYWNIWGITQNMVNMPSRDSEELVMQERRFVDARNILLGMGYKEGPIGFVTNRDLESERPIGEDDKRWGQAQYVLVPWILVRKRKALSGVAVNSDPPFIIGDFWDAPPAALPEGFLKLYDNGSGLMLFRRNSGK